MIAHELGHIKRFDVAVNFFQVIAETLFFFHPAVWWLNKRIRADREDCCDDVAIAACGARWATRARWPPWKSWRDVPAFAMAATGSDVAARVARLLGISPRKTGARSAGVFTASLVLTAALMAGAVSIGIANPALASLAVLTARCPGGCAGARGARGTRRRRGSRAGSRSSRSAASARGRKPQAGRGAQAPGRSLASRRAAWSAPSSPR